MSSISMRTLYRVRNTDITSTQFSLLCTASGDGLTLDTSFVPRRFNSDRDGKTIFREIEVVPRLEAARLVNPEALDFFDEHLQIHEESQGHLFQMAGTALLKTVYESWEKDMTHIVLHSSGIDSRLLSHAIKKLYQQFGVQWLGRVIFVCSKWEQPEFIKIMQYEGWNDTQYYLPGVDRTDDEYYAPELLDFKNLWRRTDGMSALPVNLFYYLAEDAANHFGITQPVQLYTGQWGNTLENANGPARNAGVAYKHKQFYNSVLTQRPMYGERLTTPFTDINLLRIVSGSSVQLGERFRPELLRYLDPQLTAFTDLHSDGDRHRRIADWIMQDVLDNYRNSWYGREVRPDAAPAHKTTEFQAFWAHYCIASLCEWLRKSGIEIRVK